MAVDALKTVVYSVTAGATVLAIIQSLNRMIPGHFRFSYLTGLLVLLIIHAAGELFMAVGAYRFAPHLAGAQLPIRMLLAPALYLYTFSLITPIKSVDLRFLAIAMLGPLLVVIIMLPFSSISAADKLALANPATRDPELFQLAIATCISVTFLFIAFSAIYLVMAFRLQSQHRVRMMEHYSNLERRSLDWLRTMLVVWGGAWMCFAIEEALWIFGWDVAGLSTMLAIVEACALITFAHLALNQPSLVGEVTKAELPAIKSRESNLDPERMARIAEILKTKMFEDKLYTENDLSLRRLADATGSTENHLSETFSQHLKTNFFHFVNGYRIDQAKRLLSTTDISIITIAFEVGFNSRSTFNSAFKKATGVTPSVFRSQVNAQRVDKINL